MPRNFAAEALSCKARTAPDWTTLTARGRTPYALEWPAGATEYYSVDLTTHQIIPSYSAAFPSGWTIAMWVKPTNGVKVGLWEWGPTSLAGYFNCYIDSGGTIYVGGYGGADLSFTTITGGTWNHIVISFENGLSITAWVNGTKYQQVGLSGNVGSSTATQFRIGAAGADRFSGIIDDVATYNTTPTQANIDLLYDYGIRPQSVLAYNPLPDNTTSWWSYGLDTGTTKYIAQARVPSDIQASWVAGADLAWSGSLSNAPSRTQSLQRPRTNDYSRFAELWGDWANGVSIDGKIALVASADLGEFAPALLPYPRGGWGFISAANSFVGAYTEPNSAPKLAIEGGNQIKDPVNNPVSGIGTMQYALDSRDTNRLRPTFSRSL